MEIVFNYNGLKIQTKKQCNKILDFINAINIIGL